MTTALDVPTLTLATGFSSGPGDTMRRFALPAILLTACGADPADTAPEQPTACVPEIERVETWCTTDYGDAVCSTRLHWTCGDLPGIATVSWYLDAPRPVTAHVWHAGRSVTSEI